MTPLSLFLTGLSTGALAGGASCAAVQGGLLAGAVGRRRTPQPAAVGAGPGTTSTTAPPAPADDDPGALVALSAFLSAKLVSYTLLGAVFGAIGAAAQPGPRTRAGLMLVAALLMVGFALDLIGVKALRGLTPQAPQAWTRRVRRSARSGSALAPAALGFLTVLLPCGVTLSVWLLAITSSSVLGGAAVMAGFVLGTVPLFALLGFVLRASTRVLQGRLSIATGLVVLAVAAWTANSALTLGDWRPGSDSVTYSAADSKRSVSRLADGTQVIRLEVSDDGYSPAAVQAEPGVPTRLHLVTHGTGGCTRGYVVASKGIQEVLPKTGVTTVDLGTPTSGTLRYTCAMGMYSGHILFAAAPR